MGRISVLQEIHQKDNKELYVDFMNYYLKRFPAVQERIDEYGDDIEGLIEHQMEIYPFLQCEEIDCEDYISYNMGFQVDAFPDCDGDYSEFLKRSIILLYGITNCKSSRVKTYLEELRLNIDRHCENGKYLFYDRQRNRGDIIQWLKKEENYECSDYGLAKYTDIMRQMASESLKVEPENFEEKIFDMVLNSIENLYDSGKSLYKMQYLNSSDILYGICKKLHMNIVEIWWDGDWELCIDRIREIFKEWCKNEYYNIEFSRCYDANEKEILSSVPIRCVDDVISIFLFECYAVSQQSMWDEYYKNFSFDSMDVVVEELRKECDRLNAENIQYRNKLLCASPYR